MTRGIAAGALALAALSGNILNAQQSPPSTAPAGAPATPPAAPRQPAAPGTPSPAAPPTIRPNVRPEDVPGRLIDTPPGVRPVAPAPAAAPAQDPESPEDLPPPIQLDPPICDFGFVKPADTPKKVVKIINTSDKPVTILAVQPSCKCTTVNDLVGTEIPPHGSVNLDASMKAQSSPGGKKAEIKVLFDGWSRVVNIQLAMEVTLPIRVVPGYINAVRGQNPTGRIVVESLDKAPFTICSVGGQVPDLVGFDPAKDAPRNQYLLQYDVSKFKEGAMPRYLLIETDRPDCPIVDLFFRHEWTAPKPVLKMQDYRLTVGRLEQGQTGEFVIEVAELTPEEPIVSISTSMPGASVEFITEAEHEGVSTKRTARFTPPKDFVGLLYAPITIFTTRRQQEMSVWGLVVPQGHVGCLGPMEPYLGSSMKATMSGATPAAPKAPPASAVAPSVAPAAPVAPATARP